jgi:xanthine dehydrogenase accessory factor
VYGIALSVAACLRAGTRVDVAWLVDAEPPVVVDPEEAVAITPGGGRLGSIASGAVDGQLSELAARQATEGRLVELEVGVSEALLADLPAGTRVRAVLAPGPTLPAELWDLLLRRDPVCLVIQLDGDVVTGTELHTRDTVAEAGEDVARAFERGTSHVVATDDAVVTVLWPTPSLVIVGGAGPMAEALEAQASLMGWRPAVARGASDAEGLIAGLAPIDGVVVMGHDIETTGRGLMAALAGDAGYVGSVGPRDVRRAREDWLAYRGVSDLRRVHAPAGLDIGARSPREVAVAIVAEIIASQRAAATPPGPSS